MKTSSKEIEMKLQTYVVAGLAAVALTAPAAHAMTAARQASAAETVFHRWSPWTKAQEPAASLPADGLSGIHLCD